MINYAVPIAGLMPLSLQYYLRDQLALFRSLDPRSAVSASAIYLLAFALLGLQDMLSGTLLVDGIRITYPFPQKEFGVDVIRQMPLIELGRQASLLFFSLLLIDACLRLYFNHFREQPMGVSGPLLAIVNLLAGALDRQGDAVAKQEYKKWQQTCAYKARVAASGEDNKRRGEKAFAAFISELKEV